LGRRIAFQEERCTQCHLCELHCSLAFGEKGIFEYRPSIARIRVTANDDETKYVAHVCLQCEDPLCLPACPTGAITKDAATGVVLVEDALCVGCASCVEACPFDCIFLVRDLAVKCEVCDDPLCVKACAVGALSLVDGDEETRRKQTQVYGEVRL